MRRSGRIPVLAALLLAAWPASAMGQSAAPTAVSGQGDAAGLLSVDAPPGAVPAGTTLEVVARDPGERPDALKGLPMAQPFPELQPVDVRFAAPVTVTRPIAFGSLGIDAFDPGTDGLVVGGLFTQDTDGTWSWLGDPRVRLDPAGTGFLMSGTADHGGPILTDIEGSLIVATEDAAPTAVGEHFRVEGQLAVDPTSRADVLDVTGAVSDDTIARPLQGYRVTGFDRAAGLELECLAAGTVRYDATFEVRGLADVGPLHGAIGLPGTSVDVTYTGEHTCS
jgi:hypothetical protein